DRSTTPVPVSCGRRSYASNVANLKGRRVNLRCEPCCHAFVRLQCWCLLQFTVEERWVRATRRKWRKTRHSVAAVAICRQCRQGVFFYVRRAHCHAVVGACVEFTARCC